MKREIYFLLVESHGVYVKDGAFFASQGGLEEKWGETWVPVQAVSIEDAREKGESMRKKRK